MKKIFIIISAILFSLIFNACGQTTASVTSQTTSSQISSTLSTGPLTVAEIVSSMSNPMNISLFMTATPQSSMGINFMLSSDETAYVEYHQSDLDNYIRIDALKKTTEVGSYTIYLYEAEMTNLTPGQTYEYFVSNTSGSEQSERYEFTLPQDSNESFTFMYLADPQGTAITNYMAYAYSILNVLEYNQKSYDFVMSPGDNVNDSDVRTQWNNFFQYSSMFSTSKPFVTTLGNHESGAIDQARLNQLEFDGYFNLPNNGPMYEPFDELDGDVRGIHFDDGKTYSFDYGSAHFLSINTETLCDGTTVCASYDQTNSEILKSWIRSDLENTDQTWIIVLMHRGPYGLSYDTYNIRNILVPLFDEFNVDLVLTGHEHQYSRAVYSNQVMIPFQEANSYERGILTLAEDELYSNNFSLYSSSLGVTYLTGNTATVKFYGGDKNSGIEVQYKFMDENPVIPFITVTEDSIQISSYGVSKDSALTIVPNEVYLLEEFTITK